MLHVLWKIKIKTPVSLCLPLYLCLSLTHSEKCINASMEENVSHGRVIIKYIMIKYLDIFLLCVSWILPYCVLVFGLHTDSEEVDKSQIGLSGAGIKNSRSKSIYLFTLQCNWFVCNMNKKQINVISFDMSKDQLIYIVCYLNPKRYTGMCKVNKMQFVLHK